MTAHLAVAIHCLTLRGRGVGALCYCLFGAVHAVSLPCVVQMNLTVACAFRHVTRSSLPWTSHFAVACQGRHFDVARRRTALPRAIASAVSMTRTTLLRVGAPLPRVFAALFATACWCVGAGVCSASRPCVCRRVRVSSTPSRCRMSVPRLGAACSGHAPHCCNLMLVTLWLWGWRPSLLHVDTACCLAAAYHYNEPRCCVGVVRSVM